MRFINPLQTRLTTCGWHRIDFDVAPMLVDLAMARRKRVLLIEFRTITCSTSKPVREAFAQLHEYRWRHRMLHPQDRWNVDLWAVFEKCPNDDDIGFLEDSGVLVSWVSREARRFLHGKDTREQLETLSIVS